MSGHLMAQLTHEINHHNVLLDCGFPLTTKSENTDKYYVYLMKFIL